MSAINTKEQKQLSVSIAALEVIESEGLTGVTYSKVARKAKVSRAWIYEYIGKEKSALIEFAADVLASHFSRAQMTTIPSTRQELERLAEDGTNFLFSSVKLHPVIIKIYFRFRGTKNPIGEVIQKYEKQWLSKSTKAVVEVLDIPKEQARLLTEFVLTTRMGFAHRVATSNNTEEVSAHAKETFQFLFSLVAGLTEPSS